MVYEMKVGDVMTTNVITVQATDRMSLLRDVFRDNRISGLPVLDGERLVGLVSLEDFIKWLADKQDDCLVQQKMTGEVEYVYQDEPLVLAIGSFEKSGLGRFPVVDGDTGRLVGILTKGDVIEGLLKKLEIDYQNKEIRSYQTDHLFTDLEADDKTLTFQYSVKGQDLKQAGTSSSRLKRTLNRLGMHPDIVRRVVIASYEAEMNLVIFTEGGKIRARIQEGEVLVQVEDSGPGIADVDKALQPGYSTAPDWVRELGFGAGMGLVNIRKCADHFDIWSRLGRGTVLKATFFTDEDSYETGRPDKHARSESNIRSGQPQQRGDRRVCKRSA
jgi:CBS domain-containing protein/anti-sigma regulatory factor (Ser/Thr protein kinase)